MIRQSDKSKKLRLVSPVPREICTTARQYAKPGVDDRGRLALVSPQPLSDNTVVQPTARRPTHALPPIEPVVSRRAPSGALAPSVRADARSAVERSLGLLLSIDATDLDAIFEVRRVIEGECAALAASRRHELDLAALRGAVEEMESALDSQERYVAADLRFHLVIADATGNRLVAQLLHTIRDQVERGLGIVYRVPDSARRSLEQHRQIAEAIRLRRPDEARLRMREHIARVQQELRSGSAGRDDVCAHTAGLEEVRS